jgi:hypothetical protein
MKASVKITREINPIVYTDPSMDRYKDVTLFPEKLEQVNKRLEKSGFPGIPNKPDVPQS